MSIRYDSSSSITILKIMGTKSKIQWYRWQEMCTDPIDRITIYIFWKWRAASICVESVMIHREKDALSLCVRKRYDDGTWTEKGCETLCIFDREHFDLKESTSVLNQMGCASRECKQNMKICVCDILRYGQKVIWKRKNVIQTSWYTPYNTGRTERNGIFQRTDKKFDDTLF